MGRGCRVVGVGGWGKGVRQDVCGCGCWDRVRETGWAASGWCAVGVGGAERGRWAWEVEMGGCQAGMSGSASPPAAPNGQAMHAPHAGRMLFHAVRHNV